MKSEIEQDRHVERADRTKRHTTSTGSEVAAPIIKLCCESRSDNTFAVELGDLNLFSK